MNLTQRNSNVSESIEKKSGSKDLNKKILLLQKNIKNKSISSKKPNNYYDKRKNYDINQPKLKKEEEKKEKKKEEEKKEEENKEEEKKEEENKEEENKEEENKEEENKENGDIEYITTDNNNKNNYTNNNYNNSVSYYKKVKKNNNYYNQRRKRQGSYHPKKYPKNIFPKGDEDYFNIALRDQDNTNVYSTIANDYNYYNDNYYNNERNKTITYGDGEDNYYKKEEKNEDEIKNEENNNKEEKKEIKKKRRKTAVNPKPKDKKNKDIISKGEGKVTIKTSGARNLKDLLG
jgi:hypothetical protein